VHVDGAWERPPDVNNDFARAAADGGGQKASRGLGVHLSAAAALLSAVISLCVFWRS